MSGTDKPDRSIELITRLMVRIDAAASVRLDRDGDGQTWPVDALPAPTTPTPQED